MTGEPWYVVEYLYDDTNPVHAKYREHLLDVTYKPPVDRTVKSFESEVGTISIKRSIGHRGGKDYDMGYYSVEGPRMGSGGRLDQGVYGLREAYGFIDDKFKSTVSAGRGKSAAIKRAIVERARQELGLPAEKVYFTGGTKRGPRRVKPQGTGGGKRRHGAPGIAKLDAELRGLLRK